MLHPLKKRVSQMRQRNMTSKYNSDKKLGNNETVQVGERTWEIVLCNCVLK